MSGLTCPIETFPELESLAPVRAVFLKKVAGLDVSTDRVTALQRLKSLHESTLVKEGFTASRLARAEQVHGNAVSIVDKNTPLTSPGCDALVTTDRDIGLGIYVADCAAVYIADRHGRGIAIAHSGRKGTELGIVPKTIEALCDAAKANPSDLILQISPCIRPPHYETDFAAEIRKQAAVAGLKEIHDVFRCTASHPEEYYSYRMEKGRTGRLLAAMRWCGP